MVCPDVLFSFFHLVVSNTGWCIKNVLNLVLEFIRFTRCNFYFYIVFVLQIVIILVFVLIERRAIILVFVFVLVTKIAPQ